MKRINPVITLLIVTLFPFQACKQKAQTYFYNGYEYVDLGLSVMWATCNVGAEKSYNYGDYYAWGEIKTKNSYYWPTYKYCKRDFRELTKYCTRADQGYQYFVDDKITLDPEDDVAHIIWGGNWRIPTIAEFEELINNCTWTWTFRKDVEGYLVTSKKDGYTDRSIFLPAAGSRYDLELDGENHSGKYWANSISKQYPGSGDILFFVSRTKNTGGNDRGCGLSVRPVFTSISEIDDISSFELSGSSFKIKESSTQVLDLKIKSDNKTCRYPVKWSSNKPEIATVNENGEVAAKSVGEAIITATCFGHTSSCTVRIVPVELNRDAVDLGLSVKWAKCNVGAEKPEEYGGYYAWGEIQIKNTYSWSTYKWSKGSEKTLIKYCNDKKYGFDDFVDYKTILSPEDDVAYVKWGGNWRIPTAEEYQELSDNCEWTQTNINGVDGYLVTSKKPGYIGNSIFLPLSGCRRDESLIDTENNGAYWTSTVAPQPMRTAAFSIGDTPLRGIIVYERNYGLSVRPVCPYD